MQLLGNLFALPISVRRQHTNTWAYDNLPTDHGIHRIKRTPKMAENQKIQEHTAKSFVGPVKRDLCRAGSNESCPACLSVGPVLAGQR